MPSEGQKKRLSRIHRRATPPVVQAYEAGKISARKADTLLYLEPDAQLAELNKILERQNEVARRSRITTKVLRDYVERGSRDLVALRKDLQLALNS